MKTVIYKCNLCGEEKIKAEIKALYFKCDIVPQGYIIVNDVDLCDKHICNKCIDIVKNYKK